MPLLVVRAEGEGAAVGCAAASRAAGVLLNIRCVRNMSQRSSRKTTHQIDVMDGLDVVARNIGVLLKGAIVGERREETKQGEAQRNCNPHIDI